MDRFREVELSTSTARSSPGVHFVAIPAGLIAHGPVMGNTAVSSGAVNTI